MNLPSKALGVALLAATASWFASPAGAVPLGTSLSGPAAGADVQTVAWRGGGGGRGFGGGWHGGGGWRGGGWGGAGAGLAAGAIIGGAVAASQPWYGYDYDNGPGYYSYGYDPGYGYASPGYVTAPPDSVAYCESRFRSYDPASGTYLGFDGLRHPCP
jgi:BA14K-like protein